MASIAAALIPSLISTGVSVAGNAVEGAVTGTGGNPFASAPQNAATAEVNSRNAGINEINSILGTETNNVAPFAQAGYTSIGMLMKALENGTLGPGAVGAVPTAPGPFTQTFQAPTLEEAQQTPGYQFTKQQGTDAILKAAAAAGGTFTGGTLKDVDQFNTGLANDTYGDVFNRSMATYNTGLQSYLTNLQRYQQQLSGFGLNLQANQQGFQQLLAPSVLGESSASNFNNSLLRGGITIADLMGQIGNAQAGGILGQAQTGSPLGSIFKSGSDLANNWAVLNGPGAPTIDNGAEIPIPVPPPASTTPPAYSGPPV